MFERSLRDCVTCEGCVNCKGGVREVCEGSERPGV